MGKNEAEEVKWKNLKESEKKRVKWKNCWVISVQVMNLIFSYLNF